MTNIVITGVGSISGSGPVPVAELAGTAGAPLPVERAFAVTDFDATARLGRKVARFNHRSTLLAMAACETAVEGAGLQVGDEVRDRIGITMGTTSGSITGTVDFGKDTFRESRPYLVDAANFPNSVINTTAGALAIKFGMRGANSTVAAGPLAGVAALRQAQVSLRAGHVDTVLAGASEEFTAPNAWWSAAARNTGLPGEGAAMFVLERPEVAAAAGRRPIAELVATLVRAVDTADRSAVVRAVAEVLDRAGTAPEEIGVVAVRATGVEAVDEAQRAALTGLFSAPLLWSEELTGDCYSAHSALQLAALLDAGTEVPSGGRTVLVVSVDPEGALGVAVVRVLAPHGGAAASGAAASGASADGAPASGAPADGAGSGRIAS
ncbi:3-oxoacyl-ACP synthase [Streptomyces sp. APSN-46.1]|uniref:beta-ketoacyl synthase N-terminal-like domain-containing protein n=1 Tax=Streptomyces sp. APSN-46.1 TaxID=2929049 RepID=UPI001FB2480D|nr:beta-ketoacyl synthase N-terminal-like domain-containing protein [Streptomyces sp. APSN-46.1]MCJ1678502.1 3-oxoacyl-ACP synthase [Streptomyces sp. APSN-46.1]